MHYLYRITNKENGKAYIGVTINTQTRWQKHLAGRGSKELAADLPGDFLCEILAEGEEFYIYNREIEEITAQNTLKPNGYNVGFGGSGGNGLLGEANGRALLTEKEVLEIREKYAKGAVQKDLASQFGVSRPNIGDIVLGRTWKHTGGIISTPMTGYGEGTGNAKLTEKEVLEIREAYAKGDITQKDLGKKYAVDPSIIGKVVRGEIWTQAPGPITIPKFKRTVITEEMIDEMRDLRSQGLGYEKIGKAVGCSRPTVSKYLNQK